jgi:cephalosporin-C deacetylase-like acetyl esterase
MILKYLMMYMRLLNHSHKIFLILLLLTVPIIAEAQAPPELSRMFQYDSTAPLDLHLHLFERDGSVEVYEADYASPKGGRVPAFIVAPGIKSSEKFAGIVFGHWGPGNRTEFLPEAKLYAKAGVVSILIDYPWTRPAQWRHPVFSPNTTSEQDRDTYIQAVVDLRRAFDVLLARPDIDRNRLAYVGHSYGAQWGAILTAVDRRMHTTVLMAGVPSFASIYRDSNDPGMVELRQQIGVAALDAHLKIIGVLDAINFIKYSSPIPLLFQFSHLERNFNESAMKQYYAAAGQPKEVKWYSTGHELNDISALRDRARWLSQELKFSYEKVFRGVL